ncbi:MAG: hypothetical protein H6718_02910 [Polyangiaceae bacterium]|nr:hypothetical protein [Myxococcales bacterium]MCB9584317.1 hypothetical protein [Polyangiaceae bacterium]
MSDSKNTDLEQEEAALLAQLSDALGETGELPPISDAEVEAFEKGLGATELPEHLRGYQPLDPESETPGAAPESSQEMPQRGALVDLAAARRIRAEKAESKRGGWVSHLVALSIGAAAATALFMTRQPTTQSGGLPSSEPVEKQPDAAVDAGPRIKLTLPSACPEPCCAGSSCEKLDLRSTPPAAPGSEPGASLKTCSSGRTCVSCNADADARYRVRTGGFIPTEQGKERIKGAKPGQLALCFRGGSSAEHCVDAHPSKDQDQSWRDLPLVVGGSDLIGGLAVEVRYRGANKPLGTWQSPIKVNPTLLCNGLAVRVKDEKGELIGSLSAFLMDTHYVDLGRATSVSELESRAQHFELSGMQASIYELNTTTKQRFSLALGPFSEARAEELRWQVLKQSGEAKVTIGAEHQGKGRVLTQ